MLLSRAFAAALAVAGFLTPCTTAHSAERNSLRYITRVDEPTVHTNTDARRVHAFSSFELSFLLHDRRQKVRLSLAPNHDIIAPDAVVQYLGPNGVAHSTEPIDRHEHKIFRGDAFIQREGHTEWTNVGWARINIHRDGVHPIFEGAFRIDGDNHHIQTDFNYRQTKLLDDPEIGWDADDYMVVWRDSDILGAGSDDGHSQGELRRREELEPRSGTQLCSSDTLDFNLDPRHPVYRGLDVRSESERLADRSIGMSLGDDLLEAQQMSPVPRGLLFGRQNSNDATTTGNGAGVNLASTIGSTAGCPTTRKVALMGVATDCNYNKKFNSSASIRANIIQQVNTASQLYESTFNISLGIKDLTIADQQDCPAQATPQTPWNVDCSSGHTITDRLSLFSAWRGSQSDNNAFWTLLTTCATDTAVGLAWLGQLCAQGSQKAAANSNQTTAGANVVVKTSTEWQVIAHEIGHTFGAVHDCTSTTCSDGTSTAQQCCPLSGASCDAKAQFIMNPSTSQSISAFSPCSIGNVCSAIGRASVKSGCLTSNKDVVTITGSQCGNGIVEAGEDCDCGGEKGCGDNPCCNPTTCKFTSGSVCDFANEECCSRQCRFAAAGFTCRPSTGVCDPAETCSGTSGACPQNSFAPNGQSCGDNGLQCASGQCTSRNQQCQTLMGRLTTNNDTYACSSSGCQLSCASPEFGKDKCYTMMQNFLDGTPCQGGGRCNNGNCDGASVANEIGAWIQENKNIFIPVVCVVGGLLVLAILSCCWSSFRRRNQRRKVPPVMPMPAGGYNPSRSRGPKPSPAPSRSPAPGGFYGGDGRGAYSEANQRMSSMRDITPPPAAARGSPWGGSPGGARGSPSSRGASPAAIGQGWSGPARTYSARYA